MSLRITNNTNQLLLVPLNSGETIYLAPGESSDPVDEVETKDNQKIEKMSRGGLIEVAPVDDQEAAAGAPPSRKKPKP